MAPTTRASASKNENSKKNTAASQSSRPQSPVSSLSWGSLDEGPSASSTLDSGLPMPAKEPAPGFVAGLPMPSTAGLPATSPKVAFSLGTGDVTKHASKLYKRPAGGFVPLAQAGPSGTSASTPKSAPKIIALPGFSSFNVSKPGTISSQVKKAAPASSAGLAMPTTGGAGASLPGFSRAGFSAVGGLTLPPAHGGLAMPNQGAVESAPTAAARSGFRASPMPSPAGVSAAVPKTAPAASAFGGHAMPAPGGFSFPVPDMAQAQSSGLPMPSTGGLPMPGAAGFSSPAKREAASSSGGLLMPTPASSSQPGFRSAPPGGSSSSALPAPSPRPRPIAIPDDFVYTPGRRLLPLPGARAAGAGGLPMPTPAVGGAPAPIKRVCIPPKKIVVPPRPARRASPKKPARGYKGKAATPALTAPLPYTIPPGQAQPKLPGAGSRGMVAPESDSEYEDTDDDDDSPALTSVAKKLVIPKEHLKPVKGRKNRSLEDPKNTFEYWIMKESSLGRTFAAMTESFVTSNRIKPKLASLMRGKLEEIFYRRFQEMVFDEVHTQAKLKYYRVLNNRYTFSLTDVVLTLRPLVPEAGERPGPPKKMLLKKLKVIAEPTEANEAYNNIRRTTTEGAKLRRQVVKQQKVEEAERHARALGHLIELEEEARAQGQPVSNKRPRKKETRPRKKRRVVTDDRVADSDLEGEERDPDSGDDKSRPINLD